MAEVALQAVSKHFEGAVAVDSLDLTVADGEFVVLLGPTGAGKSTIIGLVCAFHTPQSGRVLVDGTPRRSCLTPVAAVDGAISALHEVQVPGEVTSKIKRLAGFQGDADEFVKRHAHWVTDNPGGKGAAREVCERILAAQGLLEPLRDRFVTPS